MQFYFIMEQNTNVRDLKNKDDIAQGEKATKTLNSTIKAKLKNQSQ